MNLKEKMRRYLFPTYDESIIDLERMEKAGAERLKVVAGLEIGDTVYIEGRLKGTVESTLLDISGYIPYLSLYIKADGKEAAEYTGIEKYALCQWVQFPCTLNNIRKEPYHD